MFVATYAIMRCIYIVKEVTSFLWARPPRQLMSVARKRTHTQPLQTKKERKLCSLLYVETRTSSVASNV